MRKPTQSEVAELVKLQNAATVAQRRADLCAEELRAACDAPQGFLLDVTACEWIESPNVTVARQAAKKATAQNGGGDAVA